MILQCSSSKPCITCTACDSSRLKLRRYTVSDPLLTINYSEHTFIYYDCTTSANFHICRLHLSKHNILAISCSIVEFITPNPMLPRQIQRNKRDVTARPRTFSNHICHQLLYGIVRRVQTHVFCI